MKIIVLINYGTIITSKYRNMKYFEIGWDPNPPEPHWYHGTLYLMTSQQKRSCWPHGLYKIDESGWWYSSPTLVRWYRMISSSSVSFHRWPSMSRAQNLQQPPQTFRNLQLYCLRKEPMKLTLSIRYIFLSPKNNRTPSSQARATFTWFQRMFAHCNLKWKGPCSYFRNHHLISRHFVRKALEQLC